MRPSALAVVRLMMRSNLAGCSTGILAGFAPRRILSTRLPADVEVGSFASVLVCPGDVGFTPDNYQKKRMCRNVLFFPNRPVGVKRFSERSPRPSSRGGFRLATGASASISGTSLRLRLVRPGDCGYNEGR